MSDDTNRDKLIETLDSHEYGGDGKCICGEAIGYSDGVAWATDESGHMANVLMREGWHRDQG